METVERDIWPSTVANSVADCIQSLLSEGVWALTLGGGRESHGSDKSDSSDSFPPSPGTTSEVGLLTSSYEIAGAVLR